VCSGRAVPARFGVAPFSAHGERPRALAIGGAASEIPWDTDDGQPVDTHEGSSASGVVFDPRDLWGEVFRALRFPDATVLNADATLVVGTVWRDRLEDAADLVESGVWLGAGG
jgi:hypothetical protein